MIEAAIEDYVCKAAEKAGWYVRKVVFPGRRNAPDRLFIKSGRVVFIELKRPGKKPRPGQVKELERLKEAGAEAYTADNPIAIFEILGIQA